MSEGLTIWDRQALEIRRRMVGRERAGREERVDDARTRLDTLIAAAEAVERQLVRSQGMEPHYGCCELCNARADLKRAIEDAVRAPDSDKEVSCPR